MDIDDIVDSIDMTTDIICFSSMLGATIWSLIKYRKQSKDKFFVVSLCMYPFAYLFLMVGAILYMHEDDNIEEQVYAFISSNILPLNYLVMWTIELLLCFEM
jgi:hypothetical protein